MSNLVVGSHRHKVEKGLLATSTVNGAGRSRLLAAAREAESHAFKTAKPALVTKKPKVYDLSKSIFSDAGVMRGPGRSAVSKAQRTAGVMPTASKPLVAPKPVTPNASRPPMSMMPKPQTPSPVQAKKPGTLVKSPVMKRDEASYRRDLRLDPLRATEFAGGVTLVATGGSRMKFTRGMLERGARAKNTDTAYLFQRGQSVNHAVERGTGWVGNVARRSRAVSGGIDLIPARLRPAATAALGAAVISNARPIHREKYTPDVRRTK